MYYSVLFPSQEHAGSVRNKKVPDCFKDLNLQYITDKVLGGKKEFDLEDYFFTPVTDTEVLEYRQSFLSELSSLKLRDGIDRFSDDIRYIHTLLKETRKDESGTAVKTDLLSQGHMLDYAERYCHAVDDLKSLLDSVNTVSKGLTALKAYVDEYCAGKEYSALHESVLSLRASFSEVEYCMLIKGNTIKVKKYDGQDDYSAHVLGLFDKFRQGEVSDYRQKLSQSPYATHVETAVLELLKNLYPEKFAELFSFVDTHMHFDDETLIRFASEVQFYIAWLQITDKLEEKGLSFCIPTFDKDKVHCHGTDCFDMALALTTTSAVITNSFRLDSPERLIVITGPNQGGKTTFARMFGQVHYLASLGLSVPGKSATIFPCRAVHTLFQKEESITTLNGQLQDELERLKDLMDNATSDSVVIINEIFASTTTDDALEIGKHMMEMLTKLGCTGIIVTFLDELASYNENTVSMMSVVTQSEEHERTFKIVRKEADGLAYAINIARNHGLTYDQLKERLK